METEKAILKFWRDIEVFNLPDLPSDIALLNKEADLPWNIPVKENQEKDTQRRYILYFGKHSKKNIVKVVEKLVDHTDEKPEWIPQVTGDCCMAVLLLDEYGYPLEEGAYLQASYLHGIKCLNDGKSMDTVGETLSQIQEDFQDRQRPLIDFDSENIQQKMRYDLKKLDDEIQVLNQLGLDHIKCNSQIYCKAIDISRRVKNGDTGFLNSFYLQDLNNLIANPGLWNKGIQEYLSSNPNIGNRVDQLSNGKAFFDHLSPTKMPVGRWPSDPEHGAYTAQLAAIIASFQSLKDGGIVGVNGPPGTGKTRILGDIVSDIIVKRAKSLVDANNTIMFMPTRKIDLGSRILWHSPIKESMFVDQGIVVASNNNAAVENISKELPDLDKIDSAFGHASYFSDYASELITGKKSWGLVAVALGNAENRSLFKSNVWYRKEDKMRLDPYLYSLFQNEEGENKQLSFISEFNEAKVQFIDLYSEFEQFQRRASSFHELLHPYLEDVKQKDILEGEITELDSEHVKLCRMLEDAEQRQKATDTEIIENRELIRLHEIEKPILFFFQKLLGTKKYRDWITPMGELTKERLSLSKQNSEYKKDITKLKSLVTMKDQEIEKTKRLLDSVISKINFYYFERSRLGAEYEIDIANIPDSTLYTAYPKNREVFHKSTPWSSPKINTLRSNILLKALQLQEIAIKCNAKAIKNNISILLEMIEGKADVSPQIASSVWKTFFLLIPVISTSLASVSKLFRHLEGNSIGWLLLDEAGQATPQSAAGIIQRSKRSIIIGDPLQIKPVFTTPQKLIQILNRPYKLDGTWSPLISSAQLLADRISSQGTTVEQANGETLWTGFPLRTHRRCYDPMFKLANDIAYGGQMVKDIKERPFNIALGDSKWFNVAGKMIENKQIVVEEVVMLRNKLKMLDADHEVFVISPFKSVADRCQILIQREHPNVKCGTIHTFQGKEADIVFLILGSDPNSHGARKWASSEPNMLNVALTRAKKRFYVIGNRKVWSMYPFFEQLASSMAYE